MVERWALCKQDSRYEVSTLGRVRSWNNGQHGRRKYPKMLKKRIMKSGYSYVNFSGKDYYVHRLVVDNFVGLEEGGIVHHLNEDRSDARLENLVITDHVSHKLEYHPPASGENHYQGKLNWGAVRRIRLLRGVVSGVCLAEEYGVSKSMICSIQTGKRWREDVSSE